MPETISYRIEVQEYLHRKNGDVDEGKHTVIEGEVVAGYGDDVVRILSDISNDLFPPVKPLRMFRSVFVDLDPEVEGKRVRMRVYEVHAWTSNGYNETHEIVRRDLE